MTIPYTYLLKHLPTGKVYYGCRFAEGCHPEEFWISYKTSSKHVKRLVDEYGEDTFEFEIRKIFTDKNSCRLWETKVLKRLNVINRDIFINMTDNISISPDAASKGASSPTRIELRKARGRSLGQSNIGRKVSIETRLKMSKAHSGKSTWNTGISSSKETREKQAAARKGKKIYTNQFGQCKLFCPGEETVGFVLGKN